jgi:hypothetical protein
MPGRIKLGYEVGTGREVWIPDDRHIGITGQTQRSGKTTTLEAIISRATGYALAFITKRGEGSFKMAHSIAPYFYDPLGDKNPQMEPWQFVISILATKFKHSLQSLHRRMILNVCTENKGKTPALSWTQPRSLADVVRNVQKAKEMARGVAQKDTYNELEAFMRVALPEIQSVNPVSGPGRNRLMLSPGLNVMDIQKYSVETQELIITSCLLDIHTHRKNTKVILPESQTFLPQKSRGDRGSEISTIAELICRQGAVIGNLLLLDSQDMAGVDKVFLRACGVWLFGVQREHNEIKRMLSMIPDLGAKVKPTQIMTLKLGEFLVQYDDKLIHTYVQPAFIGDLDAKAVAMGDQGIEAVQEIEKLKFPKKTIPLVMLPDENEGGAPVTQNFYDDAESEIETSAATAGAETEDRAHPSLQRTMEQLRESRETIQQLTARLDLMKKENARLLELLQDKPQEFSAEHGVRTDVRENDLIEDFICCECKQKFILPRDRMLMGTHFNINHPHAPVAFDIKPHKVPGAIPSQEGADAQGRERSAESGPTMTPAPPEKPYVHCVPCDRNFSLFDFQEHARTIHNVPNPEILSHVGVQNWDPLRDALVGVQVKTKADPEWHSPPPEFLALLWKYIRGKAREEEPALLELFVQRPELHVTVERKTLAVDGATVRGCLALMLSDGFFKEPRTNAAACKEAQRRRSGIRSNRLNEQLNILLNEGFLTKEDAGFQAVAGMKVFTDKK